MNIGSPSKNVWVPQSKLAWVPSLGYFLGFWHSHGTRLGIEVKMPTSQVPGLVPGCAKKPKKVPVLGAEPRNFMLGSPKKYKGLSKIHSTDTKNWVPRSATAGA